MQPLHLLTPSTVGCAVCLAQSALPLLQRDKPQPGHAPSSSPCLFQLRSPVRISTQLFPHPEGTQGCSHVPQGCSVHGKSPVALLRTHFHPAGLAQGRGSPQSSAETTLGNKNLLNETCCVLITQNQYSQHHQLEHGKIKM